MGRKIMTVLGVLLAVWLVFSVIGWIVAALKFLFWIGLVAFVVTAIVIAVSRMSSKSG